MEFARECRAVGPGMVARRGHALVLLLGVAVVVAPLNVCVGGCR